MAMLIACNNTDERISPATNHVIVLYTYCGSSASVVHSAQRYSVWQVHGIFDAGIHCGSHIVIVLYWRDAR